MYEASSEWMQFAMWIVLICKSIFVGIIIRMELQPWLNPACRNGQTETARILLLECNADINIQENVNKNICCWGVFVICFYLMFSIILFYYCICMKHLANECNCCWCCLLCGLCLERMDSADLCLPEWAYRNSENATPGIQCWN